MPPDCTWRRRWKAERGLGAGGIRGWRHAGAGPAALPVQPARGAGAGRGGAGRGTRQRARAARPRDRRPSRAARHLPRTKATRWNCWPRRDCWATWPGRVVVVGVEPARIATGIGLSPEVDGGPARGHGARAGGAGLDAAAIASAAAPLRSRLGLTHHSSNPRRDRKGAAAGSVEILPLSPVPAVESPLVAFFAPVAGDPDGAGVRRAQPAAIHPEPASAAPIPVAFRPDKAGTGSVTDHSVSRRWRRTEPHRRIPAP
jgi:hypothetical protein